VHLSAAAMIWCDSCRLRSRLRPIVVIRSCFGSLLCCVGTRSGRIVVSTRLPLVHVRPPRMAGSTGWYRAVGTERLVVGRARWPARAGQFWYEGVCCVLGPMARAGQLYCQAPGSMPLRTCSDSVSVSGPTCSCQGNRARLARCMYVLNVGNEQGEVCLLIVEAVCPRQPASIQNCRGHLL
jgi:hypothetical protein